MQAECCQEISLLLIFLGFVFLFFFSLRRYSHGFQISSSICHHLILQYSSFQRVGKSIASLIKGILIFIESKGIRARKDPCKFFFSQTI